MSLSEIIDWPFLDPRHRERLDTVARWCADNEDALETPHGDVGQACRDFARAMGRDGILRAAVPRSHGGLDQRVDVRTLCLGRQSLAYRSGLADFAFAMQALGGAAIGLYGTEAAKAAFLPGIASGELVAGFALSEAAAGSDVAAMETTARRVAGGWTLHGAKTFISNGDTADVLTVFARTGGPGASGISAFAFPTTAEGFSITERFDVMAPHPLASIAFDGCFVPDENILGVPDRGFAIAMATLDRLRPTVGAAALGFATRATDEAIARATSRRLFGGVLSDLQLSQAAIADMAVANEASALLVYRAAWATDRDTARTTREAAIAKLFATEAAQQTIDRAVQLFGGAGVISGNVAERLYREVRALRIYEGASEVQKVIIARSAIAASAKDLAA